MTQYRRVFQPGGTFFFTVVTYQRKPILTSRRSRNLLRTAFQYVRKKRPFDVTAIVLLPDHLHTVWTLPPGDSDYSTRWRLIKTHFSKAYTSHLDPRQTTGRLSKELNVWQRRYYEHTCRDETDLNRCIDYLHMNPLKHRLVERVQDWKWSSFHRYVRLGQYDLEWGGCDEFYGDEFSNYE